MPAPATITLGHSPDPDDAFMWWPLFEGRVGDPRCRFEQVMADIESLNRRAAGPAESLLDITAMSCANWPLVSERYLITACGASVGDGYGPKLVARTACTLDELRDRRATIAVPGRRTTAFLLVSLLLGPDRFRPVEIEFDRIEKAVEREEVDAGVVIHEGQLTFARQGLVLIEDLGRWWLDRTGTPAPLGINTVRRDLDERLGPGSLDRVLDLLGRSVRYALAHRTESLERALACARGLDAATADAFIELYVNRWSVDLGDRGRAAIERLLSDGAQAGLVPGVRGAVFAGV